MNLAVQHQTQRSGGNLVRAWCIAVKFGKELPGLDRVPWQGELGKRVYESVQKTRGTLA